MRIIHLPTFWTILLDILIWFIIHMGVVYGITRVPQGRFTPGAWLYRLRNWEQNGKFYQKYFRIKTWKWRLPDGASWMKDRGFPKKILQKRNNSHLIAFHKETCRAELTHWIIVLFAPLFFFWNPLWVGFFMIFYALAENVPLIMAQRYNRARLKRVIEKRIGRE
jgi:glycosyl-4,4'-diaponeurosporenoate acyltransferase